MSAFGCMEGLIMQKRQRGFTLIELLVVVAIIVILIAILLPALNKSREQAKTVVCGSHLKQFGLAFNVYAAANGDWLPPTWTDGNQPGVYRDPWNDSSIQFWFQLLAKDMNMNLTQAGFNQATGSTKLGIWNCPTNQTQIWVGGTESEVFAASLGLTLDMMRSYAVNSQYSSRWVNQGFGSRENRYLGMKNADFKQPADLYAMFDSHVIEYGYGVGITGWDNWGPVDGRESVPFYAGTIRGVRYMHNGGINMLYADGHVSWMKAPLRGLQNYRGGAWSLANGAMAENWSNGYNWLAR